MRKLIICLLLSTIGFSQDCENSILDEVLINENVNQYFQMALSFNIEELSFLGDCDADMTYTLFAAGIDVPTAFVTPLIRGSTPLMDLILYYIYGGTTYAPFPDYEESSETLIMLDGNTTDVCCGGFGLIEPDTPPGGWYYITDGLGNTTNILGDPICACNGLIYIIDDLIWPPGVNLNENTQKPILYPNPVENVLNVAKIIGNGILELKDITGKVVLSKEINDNNIQINTSKYKKGIYLVSFQGEIENFSQLISIN